MVVNALILHGKAPQHLSAQQFFIEVPGVEVSADFIFQLGNSHILPNSQLRRSIQEAGVSNNRIEDFSDLSQQILIRQANPFMAVFIFANPSLTAFASAVMKAAHFRSTLGTQNWRVEPEDICGAICVCLGAPFTFYALYGIKGAIR